MARSVGAAARLPSGAGATLQRRQVRVDDLFDRRRVRTGAHQPRGVRAHSNRASAGSSARRELALKDEQPSVNMSAGPCPARLCRCAGSASVNKAVDDSMRFRGATLTHERAGPPGVFSR